jgi:DNA-binding transcriptional ArsR family regulator
MTASSGRNPFRPGVGTKPPFLAGRDAPIRRFGSVLRAAPEQPANVRLTGLRGVGKTVLLGEFAEQAQNANWAVAVVELQASHNREQALLSALIPALESTRRKLSVAGKIKKAIGNVSRAVARVGVTYKEVKVTYEADEASTKTSDLAEALLETTRAATRHGREGFLLLLDEAQAIRDDRNGREHPLSMLISATSSIQREEIPLGLVLCGLPTLTGNLLRARTYTERMFRGEEVGRLDIPEATAAFTEPLKGTPISASHDLVEGVVSEVEGYPYFIQLWGAELWDAAVSAGAEELTTEILEATTPEIYRRLDIDFHEPRLATLTPAEQDVLLASADCSYPPLETIDLNESIGKTPGNINVLLGRLVEAGVLYRPRKGQYEYTAPKFREFLVRRSKKPPEPSRQSVLRGLDPAG